MTRAQQTGYLIVASAMFAEPIHTWICLALLAVLCFSHDWQSEEHAKAMEK